MTLNDSFRYGLRYLTFYIVGWLALVALEFAIPGSRGVGNNLATSILSVILTLLYFVSEKRRTLTRGEYWSLVLISVTIAVTAETVIAFGIIHLGGHPSPPLGFYAFVVASTMILQLLICMVFYSPFFGRLILKRLG